MTPWISVKDKLPESGNLVWIYVEYEDSAYDSVKEAISLGRCYIPSKWYDEPDWTNILDPFMDDGVVTFWQALEFPEKPEV